MYYNYTATVSAKPCNTGHKTGVLHHLMKDKYEYIPSPTDIFPGGAGLKAELRYTCEDIRASEHTDDESHIHSCCEIYFNLRGNVSFLVENNVYPVSEGDIIITKPNEFHHCIYHEDILHEHYCLWLTAEEGMMDVLQFIYDRKNGADNRISMNAQAHAQLVRDLSLLRDAKVVNGTSRADSLRALFSVLALLHEHRRNTGAPQDLPADLMTLIRFIDGNYSENCSTAALERRFFISRSTLNRRFRMYLNTSPSHYVEARRMAAAKILLENGASVQDTCMRCGFTDYSHFIARFRRRFGVTPLQYARQSSKKENK